MGAESCPLVAGGRDSLKEALTRSTFSFLPDTNYKNSRVLPMSHLGPRPHALPGARPGCVQARPRAFLSAHAPLICPSCNPVRPSLSPAHFLPFSPACSSFPFSVLSTCLKRKTIAKGRRGVSSSVCASVVAIFKVEPLLEIPRSSVSSNIDIYMYISYIFSLK